MRMKHRVLSLVLALLLAVTAAGALAAERYNMPYYIEVDVNNQIVTVYSTVSKSVVRQMICSTGLNDATPLGTYYLPPKMEELEREYWYYFGYYSCYAHYATRIYKGVLFHSLPCAQKSDATISKSAVTELGNPASHGCIRLRWEDAEFIAKCCLEGTRVRIFQGRHRDNDLRALLLANSYTNEKGMTYNEFLGVADREGDLGRDCEGKEVLNLQTRLRDLGIYAGKLDGKYGGGTVNAVREAQRMMGLMETGVASPEFQASLMDDETAPTARNVAVKEGMSGPVVRSIQQDLKKLKLYDEKIDGVFDVDVLEAVKVFQGAYGYPADGVMESEIQKALYYESGKVEELFAGSGDFSCETTGGQLTMGQVTSDVSIRLREKPSGGSDALTRLSPGDLVVALEYDASWSKVQRGRNVGYVNNAFLTYYPQDIYELSYTSADGQLAYAIGHTEDGYLRGASVPAEDFEEYLASGGSLEDHGLQDELATVNTDGAGAALNLREAPSTDSAVLAEIPDGTGVVVLLRSAEWTLVEWEGRTGYLLNRYLAFEGEDAGEAPEAEEPQAEGGEKVSVMLPAMVLAMDGGYAPVYDVDSEDATELGRIKNGKRLMVVETSGGWSLISYKNHTGYMKDEDLQFMLTDEAAA
ncbi:MAG: SH3 domain-containing protein [Clostridia bacterium]|nr:SH3 domain-containing protein [Clostridia bacterium]